VTENESEGGDCDEVRYAQVNQEESEHNEVDGMKKGADSTGNLGDAYLKERLAICVDNDCDNVICGRRSTALRSVYVMADPLSDVCFDHWWGF